MDRDQSKKIIEALLFVSDKPISIDTFKDVLKEVEPTEIRAVIEELNADYSSSGRSFAIKEIAGGFQMLTDPVYSKWISAMYKRPADRLTGPSLETLAIIAYRQPLTRAQIEMIRGVSADGVVRTLEERGFIRPRGRVDGPGRPILYGTTTEFLQHFGLKSLDELPKLKEFQESDLDFIREKDKHEIVKTETGQGAETVQAGVSDQGTEADQVKPKEENSNEDQQITQNS
ncbi:MAG: SMC-Scp complex subunit ScpB [Candidatus Omnitrophica bacterium]|nr:SMC-Scp complex subunit ScpB [Candidatus Omnitrophota bacterium]